MKRKTGILWWGSALMAALAPGGAWSMGLGDIEVDTALNQPLRAQIGLLSVEPGEIEDMRVELASPEVFEQVGIERPFVLSQLKFEPRVIDDGSTIIEVTTKHAVREPFLNFLVEVQWPQGRLLREYTVLLDPPPVLMEKRGDFVTKAPVVAPRTQGAAVSPAVPKGSKGPLFESPRRALRPDNISARAPTSAAAPGAGEPREPPVSYEVQPGDTLGEIAEQYRANDVGLARMMIAILRANPRAFIQGNINNLMTGVILRMPARQEIASIGDEVAIAEVARQHSLWEEYRAQAAALLISQVENVVSAAPSIEPALGEAGLEAPQVEGASQAAATSEPIGAESAGVAAEPESQLKIMVSDQDQSDARSVQAQSDSPIETSPDAALAQELAESRRVEIDALQTRVGELESMIAKQARIISLQSEALVQLQARLGDNSERADTAVLDTPAEGSGGIDAEDQDVATAEATITPGPSSMQQTATAEFPSVQAERQESHGTNMSAAAADNAQPASLAEVDGVTAQDAEAPTLAEATVSASASQEARAETEGVKRDDLPSGAAGEAITAAGAASAASSMNTNLDQSPAQPVQPEAPGLSPSPGLIEAVFASPAMLIGAGVGAAVLLALIWIVVSRAATRRTQSIDLTTYQEDKATIKDVSAHSGSPVAATGSDAQAASPAAVVPIASNVTAGEFGAAAAADARAVEPQGGASQDALINDDKMAEADVYIAYGLHQQAENLLEEALAQDPARNEYRLKLLEVHYATKNIAAFERLAQALADNLGGSSNPLWDRMVAMGRDMNPLNPLFGGSGPGQASQARSLSPTPEAYALETQSNQAAYEQPADVRPKGT
jgi:pilus assembly protein FimV